MVHLPTALEEAAARDQIRDPGQPPVQGAGHLDVHAGGSVGGAVSSSVATAVTRATDRRPRHTRSVRHGTTNLSGTVNVGTGEVTGECCPRRRAAEFVRSTMSFREKLVVWNI